MLLNSTSNSRAFARQQPASATLCPRPCLRGARGRVTPIAVAASTVVPPSSATAATELQSLSRLSTVIPDAIELDTLTPGARLAAATVSAATLRSVLQGESLGLKPFENAINAALAAGRGSPLSAASDPVDRACVNVGAMLTDVVWGRVETLVDPRLAHDEAALTAKVRSLASLYAALRVPSNRVVFGLPATWAATQAAKTLEKEGIPTNVYMVFSMVQGVAAMQAGAGVVRVNVGRIHDWYEKNPGAIRNRQGPREDSGGLGGAPLYEPGLELVKELYCYGRRFYPKTAIIANGVRSRQDALALAGVDYMVLSSRVLEALSEAATDQGYNDGLSAVGGSSGVEAALTPQLAAASDVKQWEPLSEGSWKAALGPAASDLLASNLKRCAADMDELHTMLSARISSMT